MVKWLTQNFWYDVFLRLTYFGSLSKGGGFNPVEIRKTRDIFKKLVNGNRSLLKDTKSEFHLSWCSAILATYRVCLDKGMDVDSAIAFTSHAIFANMQADSIADRVRRMLDKSKDPFRAMVNSSKSQERDFFGDTFEFTRPVDNDARYTAIVHTCFFNDFFRKNSAPELMRIACQWDLISWSKGIDPQKHHVAFSRPETLGLGGTSCPFSFTRLSGRVAV
jgi:hypothetical protein